MSTFLNGDPNSTPSDGDGLVYDSTLGAYVPEPLPDNGTSDHGALTGLGDDDHPQYLNNARGDARYYTKGTVDSALSGKASTAHTHDDRYYTEAEADGRFVRTVNNTGPDASGNVTVAAGGGGGATDHGALTGLSDDDHPQYALADGTRGSFAATNHSHAISGVTGLQNALDGKAAATHNHDGTYQPAGDYAAGTHTHSQYVETTDPRLTDARTPTAHGHTAGEVSGLAAVATSGDYADLNGQPPEGQLRLFTTGQAEPGALLHEFDLSSGLPAELQVVPAHNPGSDLQVPTVVPFPTGFSGMEPDPAPSTVIFFDSADSEWGPITWGSTFEYQATDSVVLSAWILVNTNAWPDAAIWSPNLPPNTVDAVDVTLFPGGEHYVRDTWRRVDIGLNAGERVVFRSESYLARLQVHEPAQTASPGVVSYHRKVEDAVKDVLPATSSPLLVSTLDGNAAAPTRGRVGWETFTFPFDPLVPLPRFQKVLYANSTVKLTNADLFLHYGAEDPGQKVLNLTTGLSYTNKISADHAQRATVRIARGVEVTLRLTTTSQAFLDDGRTRTYKSPTNKIVEFILTPGVWEISATPQWWATRLDAPDDPALAPGWGYVVADGGTVTLPADKALVTVDTSSSSTLTVGDVVTDDHGTNPAGYSFTLHLKTGADLVTFDPSLVVYGTIGTQTDVWATVIREDTTWVVLLGGGS